ncbi:hypothetical protein F3Y22_tig00000483pilonHSYRG00001 [Hibiscus syriacus]|uniref:Integrase catalytic domain-containing protein n=1 Tax=Hibiscus syriacus TaxID=106335 RepID=A0A6A3D6K3_HIBSY|nr:hypothetical protein F3Y22_tig00000483pilonHSYRG00001 [Hibiscus syriacus]
MILSSAHHAESFAAVEATSEGSSAVETNNRMVEMPFMNKYVNVRLDDNNFLLWKQQVLLMIKGHELEHLLDESLSIPLQTVVDESGAHTSAKIWNIVLSMFSKLSTTKIMSLHGRLKSLKKRDLSVHEFSIQIKEICDLLATSGSPVSKIDQSVTLLNRLLGDFESFVAAITVSREPYTFNTVTSILIDAKSRIGDLMKSSVSINLTRHNNYNGGNTNGVLSAADKWYPDSGATHYVSNDKVAASLGRPYSGKGKVYLGDGSTLPISNISNVPLTANTYDLQLNNVLCVPKITRNLLSVSKLTQDNNVYLEFHSNKCFVKNEGTGRIQLEGKLENGLYCFNKIARMDGMLHQVTTSAEEKDVKSNKSFWLWHQRLGHPASKILSSLFHVKNVVNNNNEICVECQLGNSHRHLFLQSDTLYSRLFEMVETDFKTNIVALQTDGGGEYRGLDRSLAVAGIKHRVTYPHTSQQNGVVELYLINRLPADLLGGISPFEKLYGKKPDYQFLRVFGYQCFPCLRPFNRHKFDFRSKQYVFLGYSPQHHGYQCLDESGRVYVSRHVVFNEDVFPCVSQRVRINQRSKQDDWVVPFPCKELSLTDHEDTGCDIPVNLHCGRLVSYSGESVSHHDRTHAMEDEPNDVSRAASQPEATHIESIHSGTAPNDEQNGPASVQESVLRARWCLIISTPQIGTTWLLADALQHKHWRAAVEMEFKELNDNNTWKLFKVRLVTKGYSQVLGCDFVDTFSPVEEVYMTQPEGFEQTGDRGQNLVCKLQKALYGLRQAPRNWFHKLQQCLCDMGFRPSRADSSLFIHGTSHDTTYVVVYVDDILVTGSSEKRINEVKKQLHDRFSLKDLALIHYFLGIEAVHTTTGMFLNQKKYVEELLTKFNVHAKPVDTPLPITPKLSPENAGAPVNAQQYRSVVGALLYVCHTRPDIDFAVHKIAQFMQSPCEAHWTEVKRILRYLKGTMDYGLWLNKGQGQLQLKAFTNADWGSDPMIDDRFSEAEYRSLADTTAEVLWVKAVLDDMNVELSQTPVIWCDNTNTVAMAANPVLHAKVKHVDLDAHFVREKSHGQATNSQLCSCKLPNCRCVNEAVGYNPISGIKPKAQCGLAAKASAAQELSG